MRLRPTIRDLEPYLAGRSEASVQREHGLADVVKLGSNESPHGPFPGVVEALSRLLADVNRYPERDYVLAEELATFWGVPVDRIQLGNGVDPIIGWLSTAFVEPGDEVVMPTPSFVSYALDTQKAGGVAVQVPLLDGKHDVSRMVDAVTDRTRLMFVCSPNNPTGDIVDARSLDWLLDHVPDHVLVVLDEAYAEYVVDPDHPDSGLLVGERANLAVLRTFSKLYGLAGLRVGYCVAGEEIVSALGRIRHYFDVSDLAHVAATLSLRNQDEVVRRREANRRIRSGLEAVLDERGLQRMVSHTNFVAFDVGHLHGDVAAAAHAAGPARAVAAALMRRGVITRPLGGFGGGRLLRVSVGDEPQVERFLDELGRVVGRPRT